MTEPPIQRRLAAIMSADIAGFSRLMNADEAGTLAVVNQIRKDFFAPAVAAHKGRVVKLMGDGALVEFASVLDAVNCALQIQTQMAERTTERRVSPLPHRLVSQLRLQRARPLQDRQDNRLPDRRARHQSVLR